MTPQVALVAPTLIRPDNLAAYRLDGRAYRLMNGTTHCVAHLLNVAAGSATVVGCISGFSRTITLAAGEVYMLGWDVAGSTWHALRMVEAQIAGPEGIPPDTQIAPPDADVPLLVEDPDGTTVRIPLSAIAAYLAGTLPALPGPQSVPIWGSHE